MASSFIFCSNCGAQNLNSHKFCFACGQALAGSGQAGTSASTSTSTGRLPAHTILKQRYRILQPIGKGGMGAVYVAQDIQLGDRMVAIKEMSQSSLNVQESLDAAESFKQEAHLLASLNHPHLPSIHDHFENAGRWYLVMSFIGGQTLEEYLSLQPGKKLPVEEVVQIGQQLCDVLDYLHTYQPPIIFRDLKPGNIMRTDTGHIYLIDFGIARLFKPGQAKDTANYGSAGYSPPEQYGRAQTTERSDIYSLGATLYELLSGYSPSLSPFRLPALTSLIPSAPASLTTLLTSMLELDPGRRPSSAKAVRQSLQQWRTSQVPDQVLPARTPGSPLPPTVAARPGPANPVLSPGIDDEDILRKLRNGDRIADGDVFYARKTPDVPLILASALLSAIISVLIIGITGATLIALICFIVITFAIAFQLARVTKRDQVLVLLAEGFVIGKITEKEATVVVNYRNIQELKVREEAIRVKKQGKVMTVSMTDYESSDNVTAKINSAYQTFRQSRYISVP